MRDDEPVSQISTWPPAAAFRIFDAVVTAVSPASVLVACLAAIVLGVSGQIIDQILPEGILSAQSDSRDFNRFDLLQGLRIHDLSVVEALFTPWLNLVDPVVVLFQSRGSMSDRLNGLLRFLLALMVWSLIGVILCRRTALLLNRDDQSSFFAATKYAARRLMCVSRTPLIPLTAATLIGILIAILGMAGRLPEMGSLWLLITSPIVAVLGLGAAILILSTAIGWPLMVAAISTDDCDSFGGLSRAFSTMSGRPWHAVVYGLLGGLAGVVVMLLVTVVARTTIWCSLSATSFGSGTEPAFSGLLPPLTRFVEDLVRGVGASCFWSISTVTYLLLRHEVDGVPLDRIALDDDRRPEREPLPVVGIPATDAVAQRPE